MTRTLETRFKVLRNSTVYGEILSDPINAPILRMDESTDIKMSMTGTFLPEVRDVNGRVIASDWFADEIQPVLVVDGVEHPLAVLAPASVTPSETATSRHIRIESYDRCWRVRDSYTETRLYIAAGTKYINAIETILQDAGVENVLATPNAATVAEARTDWDPGTSRLKIVNELLAEISYNPLYFNEYGFAILEPATVPTAENIDHTLDAGNVKSLVLPQISRETDVYSAPNVFLCICSNPDKGEPLTATAENTNPQSPLSISRRGRRIVKVVNVNNIADQTALQEYATKLRNESLIGGESISITTALLPGYGVGDVVALHYGDLAAICIERAFEMELRVGGNMKHTLEKVVYNLG